MLLCSVAEAMFWTGRYVERAQSLSRTVLAVEQLSLDLPALRRLELAPLLALIGASPEGETASSRDATLRALALDEQNPSSVLGALTAARESLRHARVTAPVELWTALGAACNTLRSRAGAPEAGVTCALEEALVFGERFEGIRQTTMARDASYAFIEIGSRLERADMQLRALGRLLPTLLPQGWERAFDDVRWAGILRALGLHSSYRRLYHQQIELPALLALALSDASCPRSVLSDLRALGEQLRRLPRTSRVREALAGAEREVLAASQSCAAELSSALASALEALSSVHGALETAFFPKQAALASGVKDAKDKPLPLVTDPFEYLEREHACVLGVLSALSELVAQADRGDGVVRTELATIVAFLSDFGELRHHEKEEAILTPVLIEHGFDWYDGPVATMRRDHRQEHYFIRVLTQLAMQRDEWSGEDRRSFVSVARELVQFLLSHMDHERHELFEQAARVLPATAKQQLLAAFQAFDARQHPELAPSRESLAALLSKYSLVPALDQAG